MKVVIVGGVAGGATAAARLRRLDEQAEIIIIERSHYVSYANCGLPYYLGGVFTDRKQLTLQTPESFRNRFNIDVRVDQEVTSINRTAKHVEVRNLITGETYHEDYDKLILSPGAHPVMPSIPGIDSSRLFTLRTVEDTFVIANYIDTHNPRSVTIVGGGFIGLEMTENLIERGLSVTILQRPNHLMPTLDPDMASLLHNRMRKAGARIQLNADVQGFEDTEQEIITRYKNKNTSKAPSNNSDERNTQNASDNSAEITVSSDMVILAIGVLPETTLAKEAGLTLGIKGAIKVDKYLRTSDPDIYALGDAIETTQTVSELPAHIALAGPANKQGRIAADHICGKNRTFKGSQGSSIMKSFDLTIATTGLNTKTATAAGLNFDAVILSPASHATYYPGSHSMTMKVLFEVPSGRILGAQIIGGEGADKRLDILAVAIKAGMTAFDLTELDLAYAPPYSSAKDPVNMAGYLIENLIEGTVQQVYWNEALSQAQESPEGTIILDTRTPAEYESSHLNNALHIPLDELRERMKELPENKKVFIHCASGLRSYLACRILMQNGFDCANIAGGYQFYQALYADQNALGENIGDCGLKA